MGGRVINVLRNRWIVVVGVLALAFVMAACGRRRRIRTAQRAVNLQNQIARQTRCPMNQIQVQHLGGRMWQAYVCGQQVQYQCRRWRRCVPIAASAPPQVVQQPQPQPQTVVVQQPQPQPQTVVVQQPQQQQPQPQTVVVVPHQGGQAAQQTLDAATQAAFNARRAAVLSCMGGQPAVLYLRWQANGALTISLGGALAGTAQEACIRTALTGISFRPGAAGQAIHTIQ